MLNFDARQTMPTLLLVDDDLISREVAATVLMMQGYSVYSADSGEAALAMLVDGLCAPDAILVDVQMPGLNGVELVAALRIARQATILLISASEPPVEMREAADGFLLKPFDATALAPLLQGNRAQKTNAAASTATLPVVNAETLAQLRELMPATAIHEVFSTVVTDLRQRVKALEGAIAHEDNEAIRRIGHSIKGGCGMVGASEAAELGSQFETLASSGFGNHLDNKMALLRNLRAATGRLQRMLETEFSV
jgi:CheY-like chemotaxis protein